VDNPRDKNASGFVGRIIEQSAPGMLFSFFEVPFPVGTRRFVQFVLGSYLIDERAAGAGDHKQSQDRCRADPGPRESHFG